MANVRVTQAWLEVVADHDSDLRVSQALAEVLGQAASSLRVSQAVIEVLASASGPAAPTTTVSNVDTDSCDMAGTAFDQGTGSSAVHESSRWIVRLASDGLIVYDSGETTVDKTSHTVPAGSLPSYTNLLGSVMYKNADDQWSSFPGIADSFQTGVVPAEVAIGLKFYNSGMTLLETYVSTSSDATAYGDFILDEEIAIPAGTQFIIPCAYKVGSGLTDIHVKEVQLDIGLLSSAYHPTSFKPELHDETDIPPAGVDLGTEDATFDVDWSLGNVARVELGESATMTWSNVQAYGRYYLEVKQGTGGSKLLTWPAAAKFAGGTAPTLSTAVGAVDVFECVAISASVVHVNTLALDSK